jgi:hypothetical protein
VLVKLYVDWAGAVRKLVQGPQSVAGFWDQGYFKAKLGWKTVHFVDGEEQTPLCLICPFLFLYILVKKYDLQDGRSSLCLWSQGS